MNVKEELIQVTGHIAEQFHTDRIAVIVCCEGEPQWCSMMGFRQPYGPVGTIATVISTGEVIDAVVAFAYEMSNSKAKGV
jgi:hypothetical protein|nr:MAG TPA_asm: hypothetical protein [Caudoviricetes sp.]